MFNDRIEFVVADDLVYVPTEAERVSQFLDRQGFEVGCIQGDMTQDRRTKSLLDFKEGKVQILVATGQFSDLLSANRLVANNLS